MKLIDTNSIFKSKHEPGGRFISLRIYTVAFSAGAANALNIKPGDKFGFAYDEEGGNIFVVPHVESGFKSATTKTGLVMIRSRGLRERLLGFVDPKLIIDRNMCYRMLISPEPTQLEYGKGWAIITASCQAVTNRNST